jgi:hypothetical protein
MRVILQMLVVRLLLCGNQSARELPKIKTGAKTGRRDELTNRVFGVYVSFRAA